MSEEERKEIKKTQVEEMTRIWANGDEYARGFLEGTIETVIRMASRKEHEDREKIAQPA